MPSKLSVQISALTNAGVCLLVLLIIGWRTYLSIGSRSWPTTTAHVTECYTTEERTRKGGRRTVVHLEFEYEANGRTFNTDRVSFFDWFPGSTRNDPTYVLETYPLGRSATMYYNPTAPIYSVVESDVPSWALVMMFIAFVWGILALYVVISPDEMTAFCRRMVGKPEEVAQAGEWNF